MQPPENLKAFVIPLQPSAEVQRFLRENPQATWVECSGYLLDYYPQMLAGKVQYLIEGGTALRLLYPQRREPKDVDVLTRSRRMVEDFRNSRKFDVHDLAFWFGDRVFHGRTLDPRQGEFLFDYNEQVDFQGRTVLTFSRLALAASKMMSFREMPYPREHNREDLRLLNQDPQEVQALIARIRAAYTQSQHSYCQYLVYE